MMMMNCFAPNSMTNTNWRPNGTTGRDVMFALSQQQSLNGLRSGCQGMLRGALDTCLISAGAEALLLLSSASALMNLMMQDGGCGVPRKANFGEPRDHSTTTRPPSTRPTQSATRPQSAVPSGGASVKPLAQSNGSSCGQTSVAMCVNSLTGKKLSDKDINNRYGFSLLGALNAESRSSGYKWTDGGNFTAKNWPSLEKRLNKEKTPVMIGLNGQFSASGRGHIVTLLSIDGPKVTYADPATGKIRTTTRQAIEQAPPHPDGKFFFYASKT